MKNNFKKILPHSFLKDKNKLKTSDPQILEEIKAKLQNILDNQYRYLSNRI